VQAAQLDVSGALFGQALVSLDRPWDAAAGLPKAVAHLCRELERAGNRTSLRTGSTDSAAWGGSADDAGGVA
jgi:hypothetical protein